MPNLKVRSQGYKRGGINVTWETAVVNSTLHDFFEPVFDGFSINQYTIVSVDNPSIKFKKNDVVMNPGESFTVAEMDAGNIIAYFDHNATAVMMLRAKGAGDYSLRLSFTSVV